MSVVSKLAKIKVELEGMPPGLLFQGKGLMIETAGQTGKKGDHLSPEAEAKLRAHWMPGKGKPQLAIPWVMFYNSLISAGGNFKWQGNKKMGAVLGSTLSCEQDFIPLGTDKFEVFAEFVRIPPRTGAMVKIGRPLIRSWSVSFTIIADCECYNPKVLEAILKDAGRNVGIGAWRPQLKGPYGKFTVVNFDIQ